MATVDNSYKPGKKFESPSGAISRGLSLRPRFGDSQMPKAWVKNVGSRASSFPLLFIAVFSGIGFGLTTYLAWIGMTSSKIPGCEGGLLFDCSHVLQSKWSSFAGIPVGILASGLYFLVLASILVNLVSSKEFVRRIALGIVSAGAVSAGLAAIWFVFLQLFVVEHLCAYCLAAHACGLVLALIALRYMPLGWKLKLQLAAVSLFGVSILATGQLLDKPPASFQIEYHRSESTTSNDDAGIDNSNDESIFGAPGTGSSGSSNESGEQNLFEAPGRKQSSDQRNTNTNSWGKRMQDMLLLSAVQLNGSASTMILLPADYRERGQRERGQTVQEQDKNSDQAKVQETKQSASGQEADEIRERRIVEVHGGKIRLDVDQWPLLGNREAKCVFVEMFDYTCPHCRANHQFIRQAQEQLGDEMAVLAFSVPMNRNCNDTVQNSDPAHANACELSRLAVAVWRVSPEKFPEFHEWLFAGEIAPSAQAAKTQAEALVGKDELAIELNEEVATQYVGKQVELYKMVGAGIVPKLLFSGSTVTGNVGSAESLIQIIQQQPDTRNNKSKESGDSESAKDK